MKRACVILADGFEEVEGLTPIDYLRRAGVEVLVVGLSVGTVIGARDIRVQAEIGISDLKGDFDAVIVPGGARGAANIAKSREAVALIQRHFAAGKLVAAICAAPAAVLHSACGILEGRRFTGYPGTEVGVRGATFVPERVVIDGNLITSRAAGTAGSFSRAIVAYLVGEEKALELSEKVLLDN